ncbi:TlpA family protein disulfide reductase [Vampirovibrio sp.]|uniref:TlpA family protein disulfide reductase n=1 Tax=Vampirovibrio sp. TaxID=2717857 RepID=UPI003594541B
MSSRLSAHQSKVRLIAVFLFTVMLVVVFQVSKGSFQRGEVAEASHQTRLSDSFFMGLRRATPAEVRAALPEAMGRPALIAFTSRFCHDCQRMTPVLSGLMPKHANVYYRKIDVLEEQKKYPAIMRTFKPVSVPLLVFISPQGEIQNVLYNYQKPESLAAALRQLESQPVAAPPSSKKVKK